MKIQYPPFPVRIFLQFFIKKELAKKNIDAKITIVRGLAMKRRSSKKKKPTLRKVGSWLQIFAAVLVGIGTFLTGLAEILKIILKSG